MKLKTICALFFLFLFQEVFSQSGGIDLDFNIGTGANTLYSNAIQADGKILIGGFLTNYNGHSIIGVARLNIDGTLDSTFNSGFAHSNSDNNVNSIIPLANGKILIGGNFRYYSGVLRKNIALLNADGSLDLSFDPGIGFNNEVYSMEVQREGKIIVGGKFTQAGGLNRNYIARLNVDGSLDESFDIENKIAPSFFYNAVFSTTTVSNGDILLTGSFRSDVGNSPKNGIFKVHADGSLDSEFNPDGIGSNQTIRKVIPLEDGKFIIMGDFTSYNGISRNRVARLNADGTLDLSFNTGLGVDGGGHHGLILSTSACIQPDGKIIMVGDFSTYEGKSYNGLVRLNVNGSLDTTFNPGFAANDIIWNVSLQADSKIIITGNFTRINGVNMNSIARLNNCYTTYNIVDVHSCSPYSLNNISYNKTGTFTQKILKSSGCDSIITINLTIDEQPDSAVKVIGTTLSSTESNAAYQWLDCSTNQFINGENNQIYTPKVNGEYAVQIKKGLCFSQSDCIVHMNVDNSIPNSQNNDGQTDFLKMQIHAPNVITVNGDGENETFKIEGIENYPTAEVSIINCWGNEIFFSGSNYINNEWDGDSYPEGVYFYVVKSSENQLHTGVIHLLR